MQRVKLGLIGTGNIAGAIINGLLGAGMLEAAEIAVFDIDPGKTAPYGVSGHPVHADISSLVSACEYVILAVKPQNFPEVLPEVKRGMQSDTVLVSIAAGIGADTIKEAVGFDCKVVLVMPNTPLLLGHGATALSRVAPTTPEEFRFVMSLFEVAGIAEEVPPDRMSEIIAVNATSPAFAYRFARDIVDYAARHGINEGAATRLVCQMMIGSAHMLLESGKSAAQLIDMVCSPGGTTLAAMDAMTEKGFDEALDAGCEACLRRAGELAQGG